MKQLLLLTLLLSLFVSSAVISKNVNAQLPTNSFQCIVNNNTCVLEPSGNNCQAGCFPNCGAWGPAFCPQQALSDNCADAFPEHITCPNGRPDGYTCYVNPPPGDPGCLAGGVCNGALDPDPLLGQCEAAMCSVLQGPCSSPSDCCDAGAGCFSNSRCCANDRMPCSSESDCCTINAMSCLSVSAGEPYTCCRRAGEFCSASALCCSGSCINGTCIALACKTTGEVCSMTQPWECCSGQCANGFCSAGSQCGFLGTTCGRIGDPPCCVLGDLVCRNNVCSPSGCSFVGDSCSNRPCCSPLQCNSSQTCESTCVGIGQDCDANTPCCTQYGLVCTAWGECRYDPQGTTITPTVTNTPTPPPTNTPRPLPGLCSTDQGTQGINSAIGCIPTENQNELVSFLLRWGLGIGGGIAFLLIIYASIMIITGGNSPEKVQAGKELLTAAIGGLLLLVFSVFILRIIGVDILRIPGL